MSAAPRSLNNAGTELRYLADHLDVAPTLARWHFDEWGSLMPGWSYQAALEELETHVGRRTIPTTIVALSGTEVVGSVSLIVEDLPEWQRYTPWLASLYIAPVWRGRGLGTALVKRTILEATALGASTLYLWTAGEKDYYHRLGWTELRQCIQAGRAAHIMTYTLQHNREIE